MISHIIRVNADAADLTQKLTYASDVIKGGGLVVFPTETVYGLGADATNPFAAKKIYTAKGRPSDNPLIIHIYSPSDAEKYAYTNSTYYKLAKAFMPGPITIILESKPTIPKDTRGGLDTVAVRCPEHPIARELIRLSGCPIAAPSANISGSPSPTHPGHVIKDMNGKVDVIIDGGACDFGLESTIVKIESDNKVVLLRPGKITPEQLVMVIDNVIIADAVTEELSDAEVALSPGMKYRHYAPSSPLYLLDMAKEDARALLEKCRGEKICIIAYSEDEEYFSGFEWVTVYSFGAFGDEEAQAGLLFDLLRKADSENFDKIYAPLPSKNGIGLALYNRMIRAAAHHIIRM